MVNKPLKSTQGQRFANCLLLRCQHVADGDNRRLCAISDMRRNQDDDARRWWEAQQICAARSSSEYLRHRASPPEPETGSKQPILRSES
jgi:hypothetical protein